MFFSRKNKNESKEGIVIVTISNLFHILDISRTKDKDDNQLHKANTRSVYYIDQGMLKEKENNLVKKEISHEVLIDPKLKDSKEEEKMEKMESKDVMMEKEIKFKDSKEIKEILASEKEVRFKDRDRDSNKNLYKINTYKKPKNKNNNKKKNKTSCCDYFFNLVLCNFFLLLFNNCYLWIFNYMFSDQKNKSYCYNQNIKEFGVCTNKEYCPSLGNHDFIYMNNDSISNNDIRNETEKINEKYLDFYVQESMIFSSLNKKFKKTESTISKYSITIISSQNERYLFNNTFRVGCGTYFIELLCIIAIAFLIGDILFGILSDIFGRKRILIIAVFIEIAGGYILFMSSFFIQNTKQCEKLNIKFNENFLTEFLSNIDDNNDFNNVYKKNFTTIKGEVLETMFINERFQTYKFFVFAGIFLIFLTNSSVKTITLSYLLENALTEESMSLYFLFFIMSIPLSIFLSSIMVIYLDSFHFPILIVTCLQFIIIILIIIFFFESQRFNFEYCFYSRITEFTEYILGKEELKTNYRVKDDELKNNVDMSSTIEKENVNFFGIYYSLDDYRIQTELNNEKINENTNYKDSIKYQKNYFYKYLYFNKIIQKPQSKNIIERFNIFRNPFYFFQLMKKDRQLKKRAFVIFSFIISMSIVINLTLQRITTNYFVQRDKLISKKVFGTYLFSYIIISLIMLFPFVHYLVKCFGIYIILFPSLLVITISTAIFEIICFLNPDGGFTDLTIYHDGTNDKLVDSANKYLLPFVYLISFSFVSLDYIFYFFVIKLTKTIYRCLFLGSCQIIYDICFIISFGVEKYISGGYYYACIFSIISIVNSVFVNTSEDSLNIGEMREIKYDEAKSNEK